MKNIYLAKRKTLSKKNPIKSLLELQSLWKKMMEFFSDERPAQEVCKLIGFPR